MAKYRLPPSSPRSKAEGNYGKEDTERSRFGTAAELFEGLVRRPNIERLRIPDDTPRETARRETQPVQVSSTGLHTNSGNIPIAFQQHEVPAVAVFEAAPPSTRGSHAHSY